jgi:hypothetical protein
MSINLIRVADLDPARRTRLLARATAELEAMEPLVRKIIATSLLSRNTKRISPSW